MEWMLTSGGTGKLTQKVFAIFMKLILMYFIFLFYCLSVLIFSEQSLKIQNSNMSGIIFNKEQFILMLVLCHSVGRTTWFGG